MRSVLCLYKKSEISLQNLLTNLVNDDTIDSISQEGAEGVNMSNQDKIEDFQKFLVLDAEKRERILNAAMKEFTAGYKNASTDNIVKEAGISKGLLFHYFGTKERLYGFLVNYAIDTVQREYIDLVNLVQSDILESIWQLSLLKRDLSLHHPAIFDFAANAYVDSTAPDCGIRLSRVGEIQANIIAQVYASADHTLFRDDIDPKRAVDIILWSIEGFANSIVAAVPGESLGSAPRDNYDKYLEEFQEVIDVLRRCLYKKEEAQ